MTASAGNMFTGFTLQVNAAILALSINVTSIAFGDVVVNTPATQSITLTSIGTVPVTLNGATLTGSDFTVPSEALPVTLGPGRETTLNLEFDPTTIGPSTGQLTLASNSSTDGTAVIGLSGTGTSAPVAAVAVTPATASIATGASQQFDASVTGAPNTAVTWKVSGTGCNGATCGTISSSGLYTAVATALSTTTVTITATSVSNPSKSASAVVTIVPRVGTTYYLAPDGKDSNSGLSPDAPWLTPNHAVNCGDVIIAASSNAYNRMNFHRNFGTVTCPENNNVAWLKCAAFDTCIIANATGPDKGGGGMWINQSYWGIQGWEVDSGGNTAAVGFGVEPEFGSGTSVHHVIIANTISYGTPGGGLFATANEGPPDRADYVVFIGNIVYKTSEQSGGCHSGIDFYQTANIDTKPGTHMYAAGNFSFGNFNLAYSGCNGESAHYNTDGEGVLIDTYNRHKYTGQTVIENNMLLSNGGRGIAVTQNNASGAPIIIRNNTTSGNSEDVSQNLNGFDCGEIGIQTTVDTTVYLNLSETTAATGCQGIALWGNYVAGVNGTVKIYSEDVYSAAGNNYGISNSTGFSYGSGNITVDPAFVNPLMPMLPAPSGGGAPGTGVGICYGSANVPACMATVVANFTPTNPTVLAGGYGYQQPSNTPVYDPLFPQWLCSVTNMPAGLITMGCRSAP